MQPAVQLEGITHVYVSKRRANLAIDNVSLTVAPGEFVSLVGPSGCGKTTLLSIIAGLLEPTLGVVTVKGRKVTAPSAQVGYMLQQDYLFPWRTILQNAEIGLELTKTLSKQTHGATLRLLEDMGLIGVADQYPLQLSGGMRQRVALVRTLATDPELLLLDEPFSALDFQTKLQLEELVVRTLKERGKTAMLVTHDLSEAIAVSDRVIVLGKNPGCILKEVVIPEEIRAANPIDARELPGFHGLFRELWRELDLAEE